MESIYTYVKKWFAAAFVLLAFCLNNSFQANAQCSSIDFYAQYNNGCLPKLVKFIATGVPKGSFLYWDFGNGAISGGDTMLENYRNPGKYNVKLEVRLPDGSICTEIKKEYLNFTTLSEPKFGAPFTKVCSSPATVILTDSTINVSKREWYINGSLVSDTAKTISHTFATAGYKSVTLKVYDKNGCSKVLAKNNYILVPEEYKLDFCVKMAENTAHTGLKARFKPFVDPKATDIIEYKWSFPGGIPSSYAGLTPPEISYSSLNSPQDVTFSIKTKDGCVSIFTKKELIRKYYSILKSNYCETARAPLTIPKINNYSLKNITSGRKITYKSTASGDIYNITFSEPGDFDINLIFNYSGSSCPDTLFLPVVFTVGSARANFSIDKTALCNAPYTIKLSATNTSPLSGTNTYFWEITDSLNKQVSGSPIGPNTNPSANFTFTKDGAYSVKLTVSNSGGCKATLLKRGIIKVGNAVPDIIFPVTEICKGGQISPINNSLPKENGTAYIHSWKLTNRDSTSIVLKSTKRQPVFTLSVPGTYDVEYTIGSSADCKTTKMYPAAFKVNGIIASFSAPKRTGCIPFATQLLSKVTISRPNTPPGNILFYRWKAIPADGVLFSDSTVANPVITINKNNCYTFTLTINNSAGCTTSISRQDYICVGTISNFTLQKNGCPNENIKVKNTSRLSPNVFKWSVSPSANTIISPSDSSENPSFQFLADGCYQVKLVSGKSNNILCKDSIIKTICINTPEAGFYSVDSAKRCAPVLAHFTSTAKNADSYFWDFGDGNSILTADNEVIHAYENNNSKGYTVKMVAISKYGCTDTFSIPNYIKVYGPAPSFITDTRQACKTLYTTFDNTSVDVKKYYMSYGDNTPMDSNQINPHTYIFQDYNQETNIFYPTLYALDDSDCIATYRDTITLLRPPLIDLKVSDSITCTQSPVSFLNNTLYAEKYAWDFDNDGITDDTIQSPVFAFQNPGWQKIRLTATSAAGCAETIIFDSLIYVRQKPTSLFTASHTNACAQDTIQFTFTGKSDVPVTKYSWHFDDGTIQKDTSNIQNPKYHYTNAGSHIVTLKITNQNGCSDSFSAVINSLDTIPPSAAEIYYVTVVNNNSIQIVYSKADSQDFSRYHLSEDDGSTKTEIYTSVNLQDTVAISSAVNVLLRSYCYSTQVDDVCGNKSVPSTTHCSIHLDVTAVNGITNKLSWNPYKGWVNVAAYEIYRKEDNGAFIKHATVNPIENTYIDSQLCDKMYTYYVRALHPNGIYYSNSNLDSLKPVYVYQDVPIDINRVTVLNNSLIYTSWQPSKQLNVRMYVVDKFAREDGMQPAYITTTNTFFTDSKVDVQNKSYIYTVRVVDNCGNVSPLSNIAQSMVLRSYIKDDKRYLYWNKYLLWNAGVQEYLVQLQDNNLEFQTIGTTPAADSVFVDDSAHAYINGPTCYRIVALENTLGTAQDSSMSNTRCAPLPARVFIPTAFTPNADGHNDIFKIESLSLHNITDNKDLQFTLRIFNRWGEMLYETHDINTGWDGTFKGSEASTGQYLYTVEAHGMDGEKIFLDGTFTLLR